MGHLSWSLDFYWAQLKVLWNESHSVVSDSLRPHVLYSPWNSPGQNTGVGSLSHLQGIFPQPKVEARSSALWSDSLPAEPQGKLKNTEVDRLSLLQRIFPTQESNQVLLHCRRILYQLSYQRSPDALAEGMATPSSILAWRFSTDRGAWWATVAGVTGALAKSKNQKRTSSL